MKLAGLEPNEFTWNALITGQQIVEAVGLFRDMLVAGVKPNPVTITGLLPAFGSMGSNIASWNAMIECYGKHGMVDSAIELLDKMEEENIQPNQVTLTCVLASCNHGGMVNKGLTLFKSMRESQRVEIRHEHYACVIDILCCSGEMEEANDLIQELRTEVTDLMIGAFLNGCVV
ncbi:hypothetical protein L1987_25934 [Smallanthus sonchifolius]|uniref:Uncharacterized protein n=1 Tax=Smallanthus sonchifolius TaxID=185202 RepID=A0ACB9IA96_9ASTR|nr:hypothetical protein L1987_25934 [Smallanthus sonchifolius]